MDFRIPALFMKILLFKPLNRPHFHSSFAVQTLLSRHKFEFRFRLDTKGFSDTRKMPTLLLPDGDFNLDCYIVVQIILKIMVNSII